MLDLCIYNIRYCGNSPGLCKLVSVHACHTRKVQKLRDSERAVRYDKY
jgi:hypothetical protein